MRKVKMWLRTIGLGPVLDRLSRARAFIRQLRHVGYRDRKRMQRLCENKEVGTRQFSLRKYTAPIHFRQSSSDPSVMWQVFADEQYRCIGATKEFRSIIDCGANIGCASFYLLHRSPKAFVIVIEPDSGNFALCQRNLQPFENRVRMYQAAVWNSDTHLKTIRGAFRDGREWAHQVRECHPGESADVPAYSIATLMAENRLSQIDLLKIDIEASERFLFAKNLAWLKSVRNIAIELHDPECERVFFEAMAPFTYRLVRSGELTVCQNIRIR